MSAVYMDTQAIWRSEYNEASQTFLYENHRMMRIKSGGWVFNMSDGGGKLTRQVRLRRHSFHKPERIFS